MALRIKRLGRCEIVFFACAAIATVCRLLLAAGTPVTPWMDALVDDRLFMDSAQHILQGEWLGPYGVYTLTKNAGYPLLLAAFRAVGLSYQTGFALLHVAGCVAFSLCVAPLIRSRSIRCCIYMVLLFVPALFTSILFERVYRNGVVIPAAILLFSGYVGMYLRRREHLQRILPWAIVGGVGLALVWVIQESAAWALPFVGVCTVVMVVLCAVDAWRARTLSQVELEAQPEPLPKEPVHGNASVGECGRPKALETLGRLALFVLPLLITLVTNSVVVGANNRAYGIGLMSDKYQGGFARASADIMKIDTGSASEHVWVSRDALDLALRESPTLQQMRGSVEEAWDKWAQIDRDLVELPKADKNQVMGDHAYWALRDAYADYGGYVDAVQTEEYWNKVADELDSAFAQGRLTPREGIYVSSTTVPMPSGEVVPWVMRTLDALTGFALQKQVGVLVVSQIPEESTGRGELDDQLWAQDLLGGNTLLADEEGLVNTDQAARVRIWLKLSNLAGRAAKHLSVAMFWASLIAVPVLAFLDIREKNMDGVRTLLIVLGMLLSAFVLTFGATWMIAFITPDLTTEQIANTAYPYCSAASGLICLAECVLLGRLCQRLLQTLRSRTISK